MAKKIKFDPAKDADVEALADRIITAAVTDKSILPIVGRILDRTAGAIEIPDNRANDDLIVDTRKGMRTDSLNFPTRMRTARGLGQLIGGGNVPPATPAAPPAVAAPAPAVVVAPVVAPVPAPVAPVAPAPGPAVQPIVVAPAPAGAAAPAGGQVFSHRIARKALDWVVDKIATMRSAQRQLLLQEVAREQAQGMPLRQPDPQFRSWPRHLELALSDLKLMASLNANYKADAIAEIDAAIPAPAAAPQVQQQPAIPAQPVIQAQPVTQPQVVQQPAQAPAQAVAHGQQQAQPAAQAAVQPIPAPVAPVAPVVAAPAGNTGWTTKQMAIACGLVLLAGWLLTYLVPAWHQAGIEDAAKREITRRDNEIEVLRKRVRVLQGDVNTAVEAKVTAERELATKTMHLAELTRRYQESELGTTRDQHAKATAEVVRLSSLVDGLTAQLEDKGRKASEAAATHTTQVRGFEQRIAQLESEVSRLDAFNRQLLNPNFAGAPVTMEMKTFNLAVETSCELRIRHFTQTEFDRFQLPGGGGGRVATFDGIFATRAGWHDYQIWQNGRKTFEDRVLVVPGSRTQWVRETDGHNWQSVTASGDNPMLLIRAGGQQSTINPNTGVVSTARR